MGTVWCTHPLIAVVVVAVAVVAAAAKGGEGLAAQDETCHRHPIERASEVLWASMSTP